VFNRDRVEALSSFVMWLAIAVAVVVYLTKL